MPVPYRTIRPRPPRADPVAPPTAESRLANRVAFMGLLVAALGLIAAIAQGVFAYLAAVDTPYRTLVYEQQIKQTIDAIDYMESAMSDVDRWSSSRDQNRRDPMTVPKEMRTTMRRFAEIPGTVWLLKPNARDELANAALEFNNYVSLCEMPAYVNKQPKPPQCHAMYASIGRSLEASKNRLLDYGNIRSRVSN
jgi:hypothetical protein